ncbi:MAG: bifunctional diaminohydroxyphosphoribosylaminopyrimidine deaminase/5-amino-6-(5-phosphoribosylamino)uracil reductase RibD [Flavobacteriales bacterium]|nr:bifunctional diaminohydroxyphosphoribosylaminopyrimidine deaminase/5-amino-6-(5-phosphoribosylamino)uracil reductase RibD [Flavobacteriales bacterium]
MNDHTRWMHRCLDLARLGAGTVAPNPMVGAVLVKDDVLLAEGWHKQVGRPHAEVECLRNFGEGAIPPGAVLYVNLEPCDHFGRTPPCSLHLIERGVKLVVVAHRDPNPAVSGRGIERLRTAGISVTEGVLEDEARWMNRRFLTSTERSRPYIVLKWAQSADGYLDRHPRGDRGVQRISAQDTDVLVHRWRSEEQAILVGSRTVMNDDPSLDVRHVSGRSPMRIVIDREHRTPAGSRVFDGSHPTLLFTGSVRAEINTEQVIVAMNEDPIDRLLTELHGRSVRSVLVEGGAELLGHFIHRSLWDEARVITGTLLFGSGTKAPSIGMERTTSFRSANDQVDLYVNTMHRGYPGPSCSW